MHLATATAERMTSDGPNNVVTINIIIIIIIDEKRENQPRKYDISNGFASVVCNGTKLNSPFCIRLMIASDLMPL